MPAQVHAAETAAPRVYHAAVVCCTTHARPRRLANKVVRVSRGGNGGRRPSGKFSAGGETYSLPLPPHGRHGPLASNINPRRSVNTNNATPGARRVINYNGCVRARTFVYLEYVNCNMHVCVCVWGGATWAKGVLLLVRGRQEFIHYGSSPRSMEEGAMPKLSPVSVFVFGTARRFMSRILNFPRFRWNNDRRQT